MTDNMISWTIRNWITVFLMWIVGFAVFGFGLRMIRGGKTDDVPVSGAGTTGG
jgi:hypothetical protein